MHLFHFCFTVLSIKSWKSNSGIKIPSWRSFMYNRCIYTKLFNRRRENTSILWMFCMYLKLVKIFKNLFYWCILIVVFKVLLLKLNNFCGSLCCWFGNGSGVGGRNGGNGGVVNASDRLLSHWRCQYLDGVRFPEKSTTILEMICCT